jgi:MarR family transcriptional regulator, 2-MHQ and catechol-resistance regulon repressor
MNRRPTATRRASAKSPPPAREPAVRAAGAPVDPRYADDLKLWVILSRAHAAIERQVGEDIAAHELSIAEFGILELIYHKGPQLLGDIQRRILVSSGGITFLVDRLEAKGLVAREACPGDRRARFAVLTPAGRTLMKRIFPRHAAAVSRALSGLTREERQAATRLLRKLGLAAAEGSAAGTG